MYGSAPERLNLMLADLPENGKVLMPDVFNLWTALLKSYSGSDFKTPMRETLNA